MDYRQEISGCLAETVGSRGLAPAALDAMLERTADEVLPAFDRDDA